MAKDSEDLKKVDLKVSVNCCDGCKRKILKALSIKGVLKTEIHPSLPKITVTGNVHVQTLIKKLAKSGKTAVLWPCDAPAPANEEMKLQQSDHEHNAMEKTSDDQKEKPKAGNNISSNRNGYDQKVLLSGHENKSSKKCDSSTTSTQDHNTIINSDSEDNKLAQASKIIHELQYSVDTKRSLGPSQAMMTTYSATPWPDQVMNGVHLCCDPVNPSHQVPMAPYYYTMNSSYSAPAPATPPPVLLVYAQPPLIPPPRPVFQANATSFGDYFNDENTMGCYVM